MKKAMKNLLLFAINTEIFCIMAICMILAIVTAGRIMAVCLAVYFVCAMWFSFFLQANAEVLERKAARAVLAIKKAARMRCPGRRNRKMSKKHELKIITFPKTSYHIGGRESNA